MCKVCGRSRAKERGHICGWFWASSEIGGYPSNYQPLKCFLPEDTPFPQSSFDVRKPEPKPGRIQAPSTNAFSSPSISFLHSGLPSSIKQRKSWTPNSKGIKKIHSLQSLLKMQHGKNKQFQQWQSPSSPSLMIRSPGRKETSFMASLKLPTSCMTQQWNSAGFAFKCLRTQQNYVKVCFRQRREHEWPAIGKNKPEVVRIQKVSFQHRTTVPGQNTA